MRKNIFKKLMVAPLVTAMVAFFMLVRYGLQAYPQDTTKNQQVTKKHQKNNEKDAENKGDNVRSKYSEKRQSEFRRDNKKREHENIQKSKEFRKKYGVEQSDYSDRHQSENNSDDH